jgi:hypothetical protein
MPVSEADSSRPTDRHGDIDNGHIQDDHEVARADCDKRREVLAQSCRPSWSISGDAAGAHHGSTVVQIRADVSS